MASSAASSMASSAASSMEMQAVSVVATITVADADALGDPPNATTLTTNIQTAVTDAGMVDVTVTVDPDSLSVMDDEDDDDGAALGIGDATVNGEPASICNVCEECSGLPHGDR